MAVAADRGAHGRIGEVRLYYSTWPLTGRHAHRPPLLQADPELSEPDVVGVYQRALAAGDLDAVLAAFEPDGYAREPAGADHVHSGPEDLRRFYAWLFSNDGGIPLEHCSVIDDGRASALEYNVVRWGQAELSPEAGMAVYSAGQTAGSPQRGSTTTAIRRWRRRPSARGPAAAAGPGSRLTMGGRSTQ